MPARLKDVAPSIQMTAVETKLRILVVDDEPAVGNTVKMLLKFDGHDAEAANSSEEALGLFESG